LFRTCSCLGASGAITKWTAIPELHGANFDSAGTVSGTELCATCVGTTEHEMVRETPKPKNMDRQAPADLRMMSMVETKKEKFMRFSFKAAQPD
jgi:hypothetical protein